MNPGPGRNVGSGSSDDTDIPRPGPGAGESLRKEFILSLSVLCDPSRGAGVFTLGRCHLQLITLSLSLNQEKKRHLKMRSLYENA